MNAKRGANGVKIVSLEIEKNMKNWKENECCRGSSKKGKGHTHIIELDIDFPFCVEMCRKESTKKYKFSEGGWKAEGEERREKKIDINL